MIVLGADLSWSGAAFVALDDQHRVVGFRKMPNMSQPPKNQVLRHSRMHEGFITCVRQWRPDLVVIEANVYGGKYRSTLAALARVNGLVATAAELEKLPWLEPTPSEIKHVIGGHGKAEKCRVAQELERRWGIKFENDKGYDLSDAAALACWGLERK